MSCVMQCIFETYFTQNSLYLLIFYPCFVPPSLLSSMGTTRLFSLYGSLSPFVTFTSLSYFLDSTYKWYNTVFIFIVLYKCIFLRYIPDCFKFFCLVFCVLHPTFVFLTWFNRSNSSLLLFLSKNSEMTGNFPSIPFLSWMSSCFYLPTPI